MIVCCGEALVDMVQTKTAAGETAFLPCPGGSPYNSAIALGRLGRETGFLGNISSDFFGDMLAGRLRQNSVSTSLVNRVPKPCSLAFVNLQPGKDPEYAFYMEGSADRSLAPHDLPPETGVNVSCFLAGSISLVLEPCGTTLEEFLLRESKRRLLSFDPNIRPSMIADRSAYFKRFIRLVRHAAIIKISEVDLAWLYPGTDRDEAFRELFQTATGERLADQTLLAVLTMGGEGAKALFFRNGHTEKASVPGIRIAVADTIGAGDTFHAGLLAWLDTAGFLTMQGLPGMDTQSLVAALWYANASAALACCKRGAEPPNAAEVDDLLEKLNRT